MTNRSVDLATMSKEAIEFHRAAVGPETWSLGNGGVASIPAIDGVVDSDLAVRRVDHHDRS